MVTIQHRSANFDAVMATWKPAPNPYRLPLDPPPGDEACSCEPEAACASGRATASVPCDGAKRRSDRIVRRTGSHGKKQAPSESGVVWTTMDACLGGLDYTQACSWNDPWEWSDAEPPSDEHSDPDSGTTETSTGSSDPPPNSGGTDGTGPEDGGTDNVTPEEGTEVEHHAGESSPWGNQVSNPLDGVPVDDDIELPDPFADSDDPDSVDLKDGVGTTNPTLDEDGGGDDTGDEADFLTAVGAVAVPLAEETPPLIIQILRGLLGAFEFGTLWPLALATIDISDHSSVRCDVTCYPMPEEGCEPVTISGVAATRAEACDYAESAAQKILEATGCALDKCE